MSHVSTRRAGNATPWLAALLVFAVVSAIPATPAHADEAGGDDARTLDANGKRDIITHDPSTIVKEGETYWFFGTGNGVDSFYSEDLDNWERGPSIFPDPPDWITDVAESQRGHFWAPDVIRLGDTWHVYYSVSAFGRNTSAIALATSKSLDPESPDYGWSDDGIIFRSQPGDPYNAIDPEMTLDEDGRLWMAFGSFWGGLHMIELDPETGRRIAADSEIIHLASKDRQVNEIEAPAIYFHDGYYYLFVNWGICCRGVESTYEIRVGRSREISGPYVDKEDQPLTDGGGSLLLETQGPFIGPGHPAIFEEDGRHWLSVHFYDGTQEGRPHLAIRPLTWDEDGWLASPATGRE